MSYSSTQDVRVGGREGLGERKREKERESVPGNVKTNKQKTR